MKYQKSKEIKENKIIITYKGMVREDFVGNIIKVYIQCDSNKISSIFFSSHEYGSVYWENGKGLIQCSSWERSLSGMSRHYPASFQNGPEGKFYARHKIIPHILDSLDGIELKNFLRMIVRKEFYYEEFDLSFYEL